LPKKTFECAEFVHAKLITQVKDNQEELRKQIIHGCSIQKSIDVFEEEFDKAHGRIEKRTYEVFQAIPMLNKWQNDWPYLRYIIRVTRHRHLYKTQKEASNTVSYYVSNAALSAQEYGQYIREHWFIENKLHHIKDVSFQEDKQTKLRNPTIYSTCINWALNIMKMNKSKNIKRSLFKNSLDFQILNGVIESFL
jgi:predicted transposase YbfD/YdcC